MNFLVIGSGGREHALCRALKSSPKVKNVLAAPGGAGFANHARKLQVDVRDHGAVIVACREHAIGCVVIGPEAELVAGLSDSLRGAGIAVVGPGAEAARLEGSKVYAKEWMKKFSVPTARAVVVSGVDETLRAAEEFSPPYVLKADGLAAGKGVVICRDRDELKTAALRLFEKREFGEAGDRALLEEFLPGAELSVLALTNGKDYRLLPFCRDHKRLLDGDQGPNTGGMGVFGPVSLKEDLLNEIEESIVRPTVKGLEASGFSYRGVLFIGVMLTERGPSVLEYNVRFGDPESQVILSLLDGDWAEVFQALSEGALLKLDWKPEYRTCVVLAAEGYPEKPVKGVTITGDLTTETRTSYVLHAGTRLNGSHFETNGGRVLNIIGCGATPEESQRNAYARVDEISWPGMQFRKDIGARTST